ncbi:MAG TPA: hypothetical protein VII58_11215 [Acidobacteriaceae bacterium]
MRLLPRRGPVGPFATVARDEADGPRAVEVTNETMDRMGDEAEVEDSNLLKTVGWISAALGAVALGLIVGREMRARYKFNRRTPYDIYAHSGDELPEPDCGVGI